MSRVIGIRIVPNTNQHPQLQGSIMSNLILQILVDNKLVYTVDNPETTPSAGEFIEVPDPNAKYGFKTMREVFIGKVLKKFPSTGDIDQQTIIQCEGSFA